MKKLFPRPSKGTALPKPTSPELQRLCDAYVDLVKKIDVVQKVYVIPAEGYVIIVTVIDAPAFEYSIRYPVYEAEGKVLRMSGPDDLLEFRLKNLRELEPGTPVEAIVPAYAKLVWQR